MRGSAEGAASSHSHGMMHGAWYCTSTEYLPPPPSLSLSLPLSSSPPPPFAFAVPVTAAQNNHPPSIAAHNHLT